MPLSLITDRTAADVARIKAIKAKLNATGWGSLSAEEQAEWIAGRGCYNATDLNRVGAAMAYLAALIRSYGYSVTVSPVTTWKPGDEANQTDEFKAADAAAFLTDLSTLKAAFYGTTEIPSTLDRLTYQGANNIESLLLEIENYIARMVQTFVPCGAATCGGDYI